MPNPLLFRLRILGAAASIVVAVGLCLVPSAQASLTPARSSAEAHAPIALAAANFPRGRSADQPSGGFTPQQLHAAYGLPEHGAAHQLIGVVSVYNDPSAEHDLRAYDQQYGLAPCTVASGCLRIVNQAGNTAPLPSPDPTGGQWVTESAVGLEMAHAICQSCRLLLVEAKAAAKFELSDAASSAAAAGATVIVTSATPAEDGQDGDFAKGFEPKKAAVVAAAGDAPDGATGYGRLYYPASLPNVIAVGGTTLALKGNGAFGGESAWDGSVSGCSDVHPAPAWQQVDARKVGCGTQRAVADLAAVADPGTLAYITGVSTSGGPWYVASGTSVSAPIIAGIIGLAGSLGPSEASTLYRRAHTEPDTFRDVRTGMNSPGCTAPICRAETGFDGPTGLGTPFGLGAFLASGGRLSPARPALLITAPDGRLNFGRSGSARLTITNRNPFSVSGTLVLRRTLRIAGRFRTIRLAAGSLRLGPLAHVRARFTIRSGSLRHVLARLSPLLVYLRLSVRGETGRRVTVTRALRIRVQQS